jgi:hypothetical protein
MFELLDLVNRRRAAKVFLFTLLLVLDVALLLTCISLGAFSAKRTAGPYHNILYIGTQCASRVPNGTISCATTEVSVEMFLQMCNRWIVGKDPVDRHDNSRSAEAALTSMHFYHGSLDRM